MPIFPRFVLGCLLVVACASAACCPGGSTKNSVQIRIHNATGRDIDAFWLGAGGSSWQSTSLGAIAAGATTSYRRYEAVRAAYGKYNFIVAPNQRFIGVVEPEKWVGAEALSPGSYTFTVRISGSSTSATISRDSAGP